MKDYGLSRTIRSLAAPKQVSLIGSQTSLNVMLLVIEHPHIEGYQFAGSELTRLLWKRLRHLIEAGFFCNSLPECTPSKVYADAVPSLFFG